MNEARLKELRSKIDSIDEAIVDLLRERVSVAREIGQAKGSIPVYDPERENAVIGRVRDLAPHLDQHHMVSIYNEIMALCRSVQENRGISSEPEDIPRKNHSL